MSDSLLFLAFATLFGIGCLIVGWQVRAMREDERERRTWASIQRAIRDQGEPEGV